MTMQTYVRALRKGWWIVVIALLLAVAGGVFYNHRAPRQYSSTVTFFVSTPSTNDSTGLNSDQFAQHRANSYALLLSSEALAQRVKVDTNDPAPPEAIAGAITGAVQVDTVLLNATVTTSSPADSARIATSVARQFPALVQSIDNRPGQPQTVNLQVVSGPTPSKGPIAPHTTLNLLIAVAAGLVAGILLALLRTVLDTTFRSPDALAEGTGLPLLASFERSGDVRRNPLIAGDALRTTRAEVFRQLRTNLQFVDVDHPVQTVVVTSAVAEEGKSTTAANLALVFAETGSRVLLIEADLRRPKVGEYFGIEDALGLTNVLAGQLEAEQVLQPWGPDNLMVMPAGPLPPNPSEMLGSANMANLLSSLRESFDTIIIDAPPVVPVTDAAVVAAFADGVVLVVRYGKTTRGQVAATLRDLRAVDAHLLGTVFTMRPPRRVADRRSAQYYYYTGDKGGRALLTDIAPDAVRPGTRQRRRGSRGSGGARSGDTTVAAPGTVTAPPEGTSPRSARSAVASAPDELPEEWLVDVPSGASATGSVVHAGTNGSGTPITPPAPAGSPGGGVAGTPGDRPADRR